MTDSPETRGEECRACPLHSDRRGFFRDAIAAATAAVATLGIARRAGAELPIAFVESLGRLGTTLTYAVPAADGVSIDRDAEVILVRWQGALYAFNLSCPHQRTALRWNDESHRFQCPKHHSQYQPSGEFITGRATRGMDRFPLRRDAAGVVVDTATLIKQDEDPARWSAASVAA
jgi:nitrite reductase/ring-hydroxylating ferredoxin subunit